MVDRFIPMRPKYLTSEVCSLRPHTDRLAHSVRLSLDAHARVVHTETFHAVIHSRARLNYDQVQALIQGRVTGVEMYDGQPYLVIGDSILPLSTVISLNEIRANDDNDDTENPDVPTEEAAA